MKTHCRHGHELTPKNSYINHHGRASCKKCRNESVKRSRARQGKAYALFVRPDLTEAQKDEIVARYIKNQNLREIGKAMSTTWAHVDEVLQEAGLRTKERQVDRMPSPLMSEGKIAKAFGGRRFDE